MTTLISKEECMKILEEMIAEKARETYCVMEINCKERSMLRKAQTRIQDIEPVIEEWINVENEKPYIWQPCTFSDGEEVCFGQYNGTGFYWDTGTSSEIQEYKGVTHWMPLPTPPNIEK